MQKWIAFISLPKIVVQKNEKETNLIQRAYILTWFSRSIHNEKFSAQFVFQLMIELPIHVIYLKVVGS